MEIFVEQKEKCVEIFAADFKTEKFLVEDPDKRRWTARYYMLPLSCDVKNKFFFLQNTELSN